MGWRGKGPVRGVGAEVGWCCRCCMGSCLCCGGTGWGAGCVGMGAWGCGSDSGRGLDGGGSWRRDAWPGRRCLGFGSERSRRGGGELILPSECGVGRDRFPRGPVLAGGSRGRVADVMLWGRVPGGMRCP